MTIAKEYNVLLIGKDSKEAVNGPYRSHGEVKTHEGKKLLIFSTLSCAETSEALLSAAKKEGVKLLNIMTQSFTEWRERMADNKTTHSRPFFEPLMQA